MTRQNKIKSCVILNPPKTPEEQKAFGQKTAKALAEILHRTLSPREYEQLIMNLRESNSRLEKNKVAI